MEVQLSRGVVADIWEDPPAVKAAAPWTPLVLQVVGLVPWPGAPGSGWRAMTFSDGDHSISGCLPPYISATPAASSMREGAVVVFHNYDIRVEVRKRLIIPIVLEVLQNEWTTIGNPEPYQPTYWEGKHEELDVESECSSSELNTGAYSAGQSLKQRLTRGIVVQPVMQVVRVMRSGQGKLEKFHLVLSDGVHTQHATLASHLNPMVKNSHLRMGTIVRLLEFICTTVQSPSMVSVVQLEVLQTDCELIARPKAYELSCTGKPYELQIRCGEPYHGLVPNYAQPDNTSYSIDPGLKRLLTEGAVVAMLEGKMAVEQKPVMQVVDVSLVSKTKSPVYRVLLSDGVYQEHALLHSNTVPLVEHNLLCNGSIVCIFMFSCHTYMNYRVFFVTLEVLHTECELMGSPRFHEHGLKHKELYVRAANVPALPEHNYPTVLVPQEDAAKWSGQSHPQYKSMPD